MKAIKIEGGYAVKRKARLEHECSRCFCIIEMGKEYYELSLRSFNWTGGWITKRFCERCWKGRKLEGVRKRILAVAVTLAII